MRNKLTLRVKMALWFTGSVLVVTALFFSALYFTTRAKLNGMLHDDLSLALEQLSSQVERENGYLIFEDETPVKPGISYYIMEENGSELASRGEDITLFDTVPVREGEFTRVHCGEEDWLLLDSAPIVVEGEGVRIRVAAPRAQVRQTLGVFKAIFLFGVPVMTALAVAGAFLPGVRTSGLSKFIGKSVGTILGLAAVLLGTALGAQSVLTASGDRLGFRTAKFVAGSMIPVVGSTVGDSLRTLAASVSMLRSTVGTAGIVVLVLLLLPTLVSLLLSRLAFLASAGVADMLGVGTAGQLYREMSSVYGLLTAAAALSALIFVFALTVFALTSAAVA